MHALQTEKLRQGIECIEAYAQEKTCVPLSVREVRLGESQETCLVSNKKSQKAEHRRWWLARVVFHAPPCSLALFSP